MKFLTIYTPAKKTAGAPPSKEHMHEMGKLIEDMMKTGELLTTGALLPFSSGGARIRSSEGEITVIDGPFAEAKEMIVGFAMIEVKSKEEAIASCKRFLQVAGDGESVLHQIVEPQGDPASP
jgi:hypothetical protein